MRVLLALLLLTALPSLASAQPGPCPFAASSCPVTATGGETHTLAAWWQGASKSGASFSFSAPLNFGTGSNNILTVTPGATATDNVTMITSGTAIQIGVGDYTAVFPPNANPIGLSVQLGSPSSPITIAGPGVSISKYDKITDTTNCGTAGSENGNAAGDKCASFRITNISYSTSTQSVGMFALSEAFASDAYTAAINGEAWARNAGLAEGGFFMGAAWGSTVVGTCTTTGGTISAGATSIPCASTAGTLPVDGSSVYKQTPMQTGAAEVSYNGGTGVLTLTKATIMPILGGSIFSFTNGTHTGSCTTTGATTSTGSLTLTCASVAGTFDDNSTQAVVQPAAYLSLGTAITANAAGTLTISKASAIDIPGGTTLIFANGGGKGWAAEIRTSNRLGRDAVAVQTNGIGELAGLEIGVDGRDPTNGNIQTFFSATVGVAIANAYGNKFLEGFFVSANAIVNDSFWDISSGTTSYHDSGTHTTSVKIDGTNTTAINVALSAGGIVGLGGSSVLARASSPGGLVGLASYTLSVYGASASAGTAVAFIDNNNDAIGAKADFYKGHNGGLVASNDVLGEIGSYGNDGAFALKQATQILFRATGTPAAGIVPGQIEFWTATTGGTLTAALTIDNAQKVIVNGTLTLPASTTGAVTPAFSNAPTGCTSPIWIGPMSVTTPAAAGTVYLAACHT